MELCWKFLKVFVNVKILLKGGSAEITEKKSRFIATVSLVRSAQEANEMIAALRKQYWDARHNCSAMIIGERGEFSRCSDDGEPAGTAGRPMLAVLSGAGITNICVVVTRYFGGVLLFRLRVRTDYNGIGKLQYVLGQRGLPVTDTAYTDMVEIETMVPADSLGSLKSEITEKTNAKALFIAEEALRYAISEGQPVILGEEYTSML